MAIGSYLAFAEHALDQARDEGVAFDEILGLLGQTLLAAVAAVR